MATGAASPETVTHGFCLNDSRWIHAMLETRKSPKVIENRSCRLDPGWYAVSLTLNAYTGIVDEMDFRKQFAAYSGPLSYESGRVLGLVKIGYSLPQEACKGHRWSSPDYPVANIITEILRFDAPGPVVRANFGTFPLKGAKDAVRVCAKTEADAGHRWKTNAQAALPEQKGVWDSPKRKAAKAAKVGQVIQAAKALQLHLSQHSPQNGKQVPKKSTPGPQAGAISKRAQETVRAFWRSPSLRTN